MVAVFLRSSGTAPDGTLAADEGAYNVLYMCMYGLLGTVPWDLTVGGFSFRLCRVQSFDGLLLLSLLPFFVAVSCGEGRWAGRRVSRAGTE